MSAPPRRPPMPHLLPQRPPIPHSIRITLMNNNHRDVKKAVPMSTDRFVCNIRPQQQQKTRKKKNGKQKENNANVQNGDGVQNKQKSKNGDQLNGQGKYKHVNNKSRQDKQKDQARSGNAKNSSSIAPDSNKKSHSYKSNINGNTKNSNNNKQMNENSGTSGENHQKRNTKQNKKNKNKDKNHQRKQNDLVESEKRGEMQKIDKSHTESDQVQHRKKKKKNGQSDPGSKEVDASKGQPPSRKIEKMKKNSDRHSSSTDNINHTNHSNNHNNHHNNKNGDDGNHQKSKNGYMKRNNDNSKKKKKKNKGQTPANSKTGGNIELTDAKDNHDAKNMKNMRGEPDSQLNQNQKSGNADKNKSKRKRNKNKKKNEDKLADTIQDDNQMKPAAPSPPPPPASKVEVSAEATAAPPTAAATATVTPSAAVVASVAPSPKKKKKKKKKKPSNYFYSPAINLEFRVKCLNLLIRPLMDILDQDAAEKTKASPPVSLSSPTSFSSSPPSSSSFTASSTDAGNGHGDDNGRNDNTSTGVSASILDSINASTISLNSTINTTINSTMNASMNTTANKGASSRSKAKVSITLSLRIGSRNHNNYRNIATTEVVCIDDRSQQNPKFHEKLYLSIAKDTLLPQDLSLVRCKFDVNYIVDGAASVSGAKGGRRIASCMISLSQLIKHFPSLSPTLAAVSATSSALSPPRPLPPHHHSSSLSSSSSSSLSSSSTSSPSSPASFFSPLPSRSPSLPSSQVDDINGGGEDKDSLEAGTDAPSESASSGAASAESSDAMDHNNNDTDNDSNHNHNHNHNQKQKQKQKQSDTSACSSGDGGAQAVQTSPSDPRVGTTGETLASTEASAVGSKSPKKLLPSSSSMDLHLTPALEKMALAAEVALRTVYAASPTGSSSSSSSSSPSSSSFSSSSSSLLSSAAAADSSAAAGASATSPASASSSARKSLSRRKEGAILKTLPLQNSYIKAMNTLLKVMKSSLQIRIQKREKAATPYGTLDAQVEFLRMKVREQSETIAGLQRENNSLRHSLAVSTNASYMHAMNGSSTGTGTGNNATVDGRRATETSGGGPCSDSADANTKHAASSGESCENGSRYDGNGEEEALMDLSMQYPDDLHHHIAAAVAEADELDNSVCYASIPIPIGVDDDATGRAGEGNGAGVGVDVTSMMFEEEKTEAELDAEAEAEMNRMLGLHMYMRDADADADAEYGIAGEMYGENHDSGEGGAERLDLTLKSFHGFEDVESGPHHAYTGDENGLAITSVAGADAGIEAAGDADADDIDVSFLRDLELADEVHTFICVDEEEKDYTEAITPKFDPLKEQEEAGSSMALLHIGGIDEGDEAGDDAVVQIAVSVDTRGDVGIDVC